MLENAFENVDGRYKIINTLHLYVEIPKRIKTCCPQSVKDKRKWSFDIVDKSIEYLLFKLTHIKNIQPTYYVIHFISTVVFGG